MLTQQQRAPYTTASLRSEKLQSKATNKIKHNSSSNNENKSDEV